MPLPVALFALQLVLPVEGCLAGPAGQPHASLASSAAAATAVADSALLALYESGETFEAFLANARARRALWVRNWENGTVPADALARATALPGRWRLLVVAVDACSDSVNTIPYLARLVAAVPSLEMRIITPDAGRALMEARRTPDGRAATPTVIILDALGNEAGCWVERPSELQSQAIAARQAGNSDQFVAGKQQWYDADAGASTIRELVALLAAAADGHPRCGVPPATTPSGTID